MGEGIIIVGGGIIGVSAAYALARRGAAVILLEAGEIGEGSSFGNAGLICPCHSTPIPGPGVLAQGLRWMLNPVSPFYIRPRLDPQLVSWLWQFSRSCNAAARDRAIPALLGMQRASQELYENWLEETGIDAAYERAGGLELFLSEEKFRRADREVQHMQAAGIRMALLDRSAVLALEPAASPNIVGGIHYQEDSHIDPARFVRALAEEAERCGVQICTHTRVLEVERSGGRITRLVTSDDAFEPDEVVVAAGAWSARVLRMAGIRLPLQPAKGYSITMTRPSVSPRIPLHLAEARMAVTPMGSTLRFAGTLELTGIDTTINQRRVQAIREGGRRYLASREPLNELDVWAGLRPVAPDGLPYIGRHPALENLVVAAGHAMLGVSMGPVTGMLVAEILSGERPSLDLSPFRVDRFS